MTIFGVWIDNNEQYEDNYSLFVSYHFSKKSAEKRLKKELASHNRGRMEYEAKWIGKVEEITVED